MDRWVDRRKDKWMDGRQVNRWTMIIIINLANRINTHASQRPLRPLKILKAKFSIEFPLKPIFCLCLLDK